MKERIRISPEHGEFGFIITPSNRARWPRFWFHTPVYHPQGGRHGHGYFSATKANKRVVEYHPKSQENLAHVRSQVKAHVKNHGSQRKKAQTNRGLPITIQEDARDHR